MYCFTLACILCIGLQMYFAVTLLLKYRKMQTHHVENRFGVLKLFYCFFVFVFVFTTYTF